MLLSLLLVSYPGLSGACAVMGMLYSGDQLMWYENNGSPNASGMFNDATPQHSVDTRLSGVRDIILVDLNLDGMSPPNRLSRRALRERMLFQPYHFCYQRMT